MINFDKNMREEILSSLDKPGQLEKLYRESKQSFKTAFNNLYPEIQQNPLAEFWRERLHYTEETSWGSRNELVFIILAALAAGIVAKIPAWLPTVDEEFFYSRNAGFIIFPFITAYLAWKSSLPMRKIALLAGISLAALLFINLLPGDHTNDTVVLSCIHMLLFLWSLVGFAYIGGDLRNLQKRISYLRFNGDLVVMTTLLLLAGGILTGITIGLFSLINLQIEEFYMENIGLMGLAAAPVIGTYLTQVNPQLVNKVSPVIAKLFSPLVLVMLVAYLVAIVYSGKDPYNDREFLILFNALLIGVMALILFSVAETSRSTENRAGVLILLLLSVVTIVVNGIALSAILFRISEWGITPNRAAVLGSNLLILVNLLLVTVSLAKVLFRKQDLAGVGRSIAAFLPFYTIWIAIVAFLFPFIFGFA